MDKQKAEAIFEKEGTKVRYKNVSYIEDFEAFMASLEEQGGLMAAGEVGEAITRMSSYFTRHNVILGRTLKMFSRVAKDAICVIEDNGKPVSAAKASIMADASDEAAAYQEAKVHVQNIEQNINALKALQRGILNEYSHSAT